jgi:hypothetical protein
VGRGGAGLGRAWLGLAGHGMVMKDGVDLAPSPFLSDIRTVHNHPVQQSVAVECPSCGRVRDVSPRTARRGPGKCRFCLSPHSVPPVDDGARRYWLKRFSDVELAEIATGLIGRTIKPEVFHQRRVLLGSVDDEDV